MFKKITLWTVYFLIVGLLIFGAANRTSAKTDQGFLFGNSNEVFVERGQGNNSSGRNEGYGEFEADDHDEIIGEQDWVVLSGQITNISSDNLEIQTVTAGILEIEGRSWRFVQELGYVPVEGNELVVQGFFENGEFEVSIIQDLTADQDFRIRDEYGRPMWGGGGSN